MACDALVARRGRQSGAPDCRRRHRTAQAGDLPGHRRPAPDGGWTLRAARDHSVGFEVARYDTTRPLVIDPVLSYSTYLGGNGNDIGYAIAVDSAGNAYVTGVTTSTNFPGASASPIQSSVDREQ